MHQSGKQRYSHKCLCVLAATASNKGTLGHIFCCYRCPQLLWNSEHPELERALPVACKQFYPHCTRRPTHFFQTTHECAVPASSFPKVSASKPRVQAALSHGKCPAEFQHPIFSLKLESLNQGFVTEGLLSKGSFYAKRGNPTYVPHAYAQGGCPTVIFNLMQDLQGAVFQWATLRNQHREIKGVPHQQSLQSRQGGKRAGGVKETCSEASPGWHRRACQCADRITESQNSRGWKGPLWVI